MLRRTGLLLGGLNRTAMRDMPLTEWPQHVTQVMTILPLSASKALEAPCALFEQGGYSGQSPRCVA